MLPALESKQDRLVSGTSSDLVTITKTEKNVQFSN